MTHNHQEFVFFTDTKIFFFFLMSRIFESLLSLLTPTNLAHDP